LVAGAGFEPTTSGIEVWGKLLPTLNDIAQASPDEVDAVLAMLAGTTLDPLEREAA
jgi:hypothetical protein